jgi:undecaprenyl diphosphate synthase
MVVREIVTACAELGVKALTLYAFSADNYWKRPRTEVMVLMGLLVRFLKIELREMMDKDIRFNVIGHPEKLPAAARVWLKRTARATSRNSGLVLTLALNYSSRQEILDAARKLAVRNGTARKPLERDDFRGFLSTAGLPDPDLVIRTSGEMRLSDFLLWQAAYAELWFTSVLWPDFRRSHLIKAIRDFQRRQRRFGAVTALAPARPALGQLRWPRTPA